MINILHFLSNKFVVFENKEQLTKIIPELKGEEGLWSLKINYNKTENLFMDREDLNINMAEIEIQKKNEFNNYEHL